jgi:hypothetical protein
MIPDNYINRVFPTVKLFLEMEKKNMASQLKDKTAKIEHEQPKRAHYGFYLTQYQKQQILTLVKIGVSSNQSAFLKDAAIARIQQYAHLITPDNLVQLPEPTIDEV